ncbi:zinc-dependent alcohol dehydrogenase family protein [Planctomicrobium piriforme]|uniref:NADPH:quinone reductase n=1 Tax=Planctomicrobium piriforme TaxID=1576369 RepID=A0A1I3G4K9_9PLAN|nr:zinc-dependent alcohol dehydrogenase family protein [Planctomicrobium piriforme]SFI18435.1 NADPH:quinone reductase [Planctomicrobium piriforme]
MSRVVRFHKTGGPEVLQIDNLDVPAPGSGEVRIQVKALGLNRAEAMYRSGMYLEDPTPPSRLGYEAAGVVDAVGPGVTAFKVGDAVSTIPAFSMGKYGVYGDVALVPAAAVAKHPANLSWVEASAIWMQYLTAYGALIDIAKMTSGDVVLIPAASSSVGISAIQMANMVGATPVALTRTSDKRDALLKLGAAHVIATEEQDLVKEVQKLTDGKGARIAFDPVGGPTVAKLASALCQFGILFQYGALSTEPTPLPLMDVLGKSLTIRGYVLFEWTVDAAQLEAGKKFVTDGLASGKLKPIVAKTFPLDQIVEAHRYMESNQQIGKIVVTV